MQAGQAQAGHSGNDGGHVGNDVKTCKSQELYTQAESVYDFWTKEDVEATAKEIASAQTAIGEFNAMAKAALTKLKSCLVTAEKELSTKAEQESAKKKLKRGQQSGNGVVLHDSGFGMATPLSSIVMKDGKPQHTFDAQVLFLVAIPTSSVGAEVMKAVDLFKPKFEATIKERLGNGKDIGNISNADPGFRAQRPPKEQKHCDLIGELLGACLHGATILPESIVPQAFKTNMISHVFGIEKNYSLASNESNHFASVRCGVAGRRSMAIAKTAQLCAFFSSQVKDGTASLTLK